MLELSPTVLTILVLLALALAAFTLFILVSTTPRKKARTVSDTKEAVELLAEHDQAIAQLRHTLRQVADEQGRQADGLLGVVQRVGLVRYDAFEDMAGRLSFSAALLDATGNGVVITSINGRQETRCYAKPIKGGASEHNISVEEEQAITQALTPGHEPAPAGDGRGGRTIA
jgi:uncharacterized protein YlxW (UPF0749 family)